MKTKMDSSTDYIRDYRTELKPRLKILGLFAIIASIALFCGGCSTNAPMNKALFVTTVSTGVAIGTDRYPEAVPYLRVAAPIICAASESTNVSPAEVVDALQNSPAANAIATPEGKLILNAALVIYISVFESYGADAVKNNEQLQQYLKWTCGSIQLGLPSVTNTLAASRSARQARREQLPPHVK